MSNYIARAKQYASYHGLPENRACIIVGRSQRTNVEVVFTPAACAERWVSIYHRDFILAGGVFGNITGARHLFAEACRTNPQDDSHITDIRIIRLNTGVPHAILSASTSSRFAPLTAPYFTTHR